MKSILNVLAAIISFSFIGISAQAEGISESAYLLREAMMQSNADYNKHKKKTNYEEFDRADEWGERNNLAISIDQKNLKKSDYQDFQQIKDDFNDGQREVSSNVDQKDWNLEE